MMNLKLSPYDLRLIHKALNMKIQSIDFQLVGAKSDSVDFRNLDDELKSYIQLLVYIDNERSEQS